MLVVNFVTHTGKKVTSEVNRIMGPVTPTLSYNTPTHTLTSSDGLSQIPRQPNCKSNVFKYMGTDPPNSFIHCGFGGHGRENNESTPRGQGSGGQGSGGQGRRGM